MVEYPAMERRAWYVLHVKPRTEKKIKADNPDLPAFETYEDFLKGIVDALG